jgi:hypothetical protein
VPNGSSHQSLSLARYLGIGFKVGATPGGSGVRPTLSAIEMSE